MERIITSRQAVALLVAAAITYALGTAFEVAAFATLTPTNVTTSANFSHASAWLHFGGGLLGLLAVCAAGWELVLARSADAVWEAAAAAVGTLLIAIGLLVLATSGQTSSAANVVSAVGIGVWALLVLSRAARRSLAEEEARSSQARFEHQAVLWLAAAAGLFVLAVGFGFTLQAASKSTGIAAGVLQAIGVGALLAALAVARSRGYLTATATPVVLEGLALLTAGFIAVAIVAGIVFGSGATLTGLRIGISVALTIQLLAVVAFGLAAWTRLRQLVLESAQPS